MSTWRDNFERFHTDDAFATPSAQPLYTTPLHSASSTQPFGPTTRPLGGGAPPQERMLAAAALRDVGRQRMDNQDQCFAQLLTLPTDQRTLTLGLFVVADGMGGHHDGGYAALLALTTVVQSIQTEFIAPVLGRARPTPQPLMHAAVGAANAAVFSAGQARGTDMGTTCTAALLYEDELIVAHVGDSRALLIGAGVQQLTTDHSAIGRLIAIGALSPEEAQDHPLRNQLYRTVGQQPVIPVDVTTTRLRGETHLVLCSDGLWGLVSHEQIADIVVETSTPQAAARELIAQANLRGGDDNISVVVVTLPEGRGPRP